MIAPGDALLVLASASAARAQLLRNAGVPFEQDAADLDEASIKESCRRNGLSAEESACELAQAKALAVSQRRPRALVIGADQLLVHAGTWFDKPGSAATARATLRALRGQRHRLISGVAAVRNGRVLWRHVEQAQLVMRSYTDAFVNWYFERADEAEWQVVGACRLEGLGAQAFARVDGDYFTILGMPMLPLLDFLRNEGVLIP
jgi:septum formation protein